MWVVTRAINDYNQDGDYLVCVFENKPTFQDLKKILPYESDVTIGKLTRGGGRHNFEGCWYYLTELKSGELYIS
jgi:hypothetical protein